MGHVYIGLFCFAYPKPTCTNVCIAIIIAVIFVFGSGIYRAGVVFVNTCSLLLCFHPKPYFLMYEGYVIWAIKSQNLT